MSHPQSHCESMSKPTDPLVSMLAGRQSGIADQKWSGRLIRNTGFPYRGALTIRDRLHVRRVCLPRSNARATRCTNLSTSSENSPRVIAKGTAWWLTGSLLAAGGAAPNLLLGHEWSTVSHTASGLSLVATLPVCHAHP